jgi:hypothetical protein
VNEHYAAPWTYSISELFLGCHHTFPPSEFPKKKYKKSKRCD